MRPSRAAAADRLAALPDFLRERARPFLIAHRGASAQLPENGMAAFRRAVAEGADALETDLWFSADGVLVCHHDATVERTTGEAGRIDQLPMADIARLRLLGGDGRAAGGIPSLEELLAWMPADRLLILELKDPRFRDPDQAGRLAALIAPRIAAAAVVAISYEPRLLAAAKAADPRLATGLVVRRALLPGRQTEFLGPYWPILFLNPWYLKLAQRRGQWVAPLDPRLHRRLRHYLRWGVDALLTSDPAATRRRMEALRP